MPPFFLCLPYLALLGFWLERFVDDWNGVLFIFHAVGEIHDIKSDR